MSNKFLVKSSKLENQMIANLTLIRVGFLGVRFVVVVVSFISHVSRIQLSDGCKLAINWKKDNGVTIC